MEKQDKMIIEIDHEDMVNMVCGLDVEYDDIPTLEKMGLGYRNLAFRDDWEWDRYAIEELSTEELYDMYKKIKSKQKLQPHKETQNKESDLGFDERVFSIKDKQLVLFEKVKTGEITFIEFLKQNQKLINHV